MASTFTLDPAGIREVAASPELSAQIVAVGDAIIGAAGAVSPSATFTGSLEVLDVSEGDTGTVVTVGSRWSFAHLIEWGSVNNAPYAPLRSAVSSLGLKFEEA